MSNEEETTLYERVGGDAALSSIVDHFYGRVQEDAELAPFFEKVPMNRQRKMLGEFLKAALGGPSQYQGRPLAEVHQGLGINLHHFDLFIGHLRTVLEDQDLTTDDQYEIIEHLDTKADEILGEG